MEKYSFEKKTLWVVLLTAVTMVVEIIFGLTTRSMALLADGIHMGSHVLAIGLSWLAYVIVRKVSKSKKFNGNSDKILSLSSYSMITDIATDTGIITKPFSYAPWN
ncbi:MAG: cation transporter [Bacteroidales bacterium]|nr:cation transporter [Bacteroidales bacterium]